MIASGSAICIVRKIRSTELSRSLHGIPFRNCPVAIADQVHGSSVRAVTHGGVYEKTDGFVTTDPDIILTIRIADCVPMVMRSQTGRLRGLVHAGRNGIADGIVESAISAANILGESEDVLSVWLGPHIGPCCYRFPVDHPVSRELIQRLPNGCSVSDDTIIVDLAREIRVRLEHSGIDALNIFSDSRCTACSAGILPSHKRDGIHRTRTLLMVSAHGFINKEKKPMAVDPELLKILACPETKEPVLLASKSLVNRLNELIEEGVVKNRGGESITEKIDDGLVREDKRYLYPIRDDIPIMLIEEAIELPPLELPDTD